ncbi:XAC0095 family protein [Luteimonas salinilitoris]|uniref:XAC0095 family protein n=1 Tax=Luteimonas salinilitoris TaxID=3237697 RepID=A0ABV4HUC0_9GAMM
MSEDALDKMETTGYFLPEDSQFRLKKLREHMMFLSHLAQPRTHDEEHEWGPDIRTGELAVCLELLAEQAGLVLDEVLWRAERVERRTGAGADADADLDEESTAPAAGGAPFAVSLAQIDALGRLIDMLSAHGDMVMAAEDAELANGTLAQLGQAIWDGASAVREIVSQINAQRLDQAPQSRTGVGEERALYGARGAVRAKPHPVGLMIPGPAPSGLQQASHALH